MPIRSSIIRVASGEIAIDESDGPGLPTLLIHGNSSCKEVFRRQLEGPVGQRYRLIALDLPGHGESSDAAEPERTYSMMGYAEACCQVIEAMRIDRVALVGWSLGGHVALELAERHPGVAGVMIVGTPPYAPGIFGMLRAFQPQFGLYLATKARLSKSEIKLFARGSLGRAANTFFERRIERTDPRARPLLFRSMVRGKGADQRRIAERFPWPLAVVNGAREPVARLGYLQRIAFANLWEERCHVIAGAGHAPFIQTPDAFDDLLLRFLNSVSSGRSHVSSSRSPRLPLSA